MGSCLSADGRNSTSYSPSATPMAAKRKNMRRKSFRASSFEAKREEQLHRIPGRMFLNGASDVASLFTQQGKKGTNQDAMIVWENFGSRTDTVFCGVFDGHGPFGHMVARRVRDCLPLKLSAHWEVNIGNEDGPKGNSSRVGSMNSDETASLCDEESGALMDVDEKEKQPEIFLTLKESFLKAFKVMDKELRLHPNIDCFCSGTTAVTLVKQDEPEVARVWLPHNDSPGLAMARAFGDFCLKDFGLISVPEISYRRLTEKDEFIVMATDGVWDVLSNNEVVDIVASAPTQSSASRFLVESAVRAWRSKYPTSKVDDCAVVCLFLDSSPDNSTTAVITSAACASPTTEQTPLPPDQINANEETQENLQGPTELERSGTVRAPEIMPEEASEKTLEQAAKSQQLGEDWSALEGVSRVNTLLTLPRFVPGKDDKKAMGEKKARM
ncbi:hypothetical protein Scep_010813 [Stephania cephalantha]|uniref:PPM-type phosphatase domain-containing protein n=1 Tax=Stephania cephalantha TaxID=152367 RepID=A0AAP0JVW0_9MAGN